MKEQEQKLTGSFASRYDRGKGKSMSETGNGTELLENIDPQILEAWMPQLKSAQGQDERSAIWTAAKLGAMPSEKGADDMTKEEVDRKFGEIKTAESKERKRTKIEQNIDNFVKAIQKEPKCEGSSYPKDSEDGKHRKEKLRDKKDWSDIGWGEAKRKEVEGKLREKFSRHHALSDEQMTNTIELLVASGRTAAQAAEDIKQIPTKFDYTSQEAGEAGRTIEALSRNNKYNFFSQLEIDGDNIQRFVLQDDFAAENEDHYQRTDPSNMEEIAWQVMHHYGHKTWGPNGTFPLLEMRIGYVRDEKTGELIYENGKPQVDAKKSKYYVNQSNFVRWARERMWNLYDINNDVGDFISAIDLPKTYGKMDFSRMFPQYTKYFASEDGETTYYEMAQELIVESYGLGVTNQMATKYKQEMRDPDGLQKAIGEMFATNAFTKETFRKNLFQLMTIMPLNYEGQKPGEILERDGVFGGAMMEMFLVYYNLSDFEELQKILGKGSSFFTRDAYVWALQSVTEEKVLESSGESKPTILNAQTQDYLEKAFDKDGQITTGENKENFIKLINFFAQKTNNEDAEYVVRRLLYRVAAEKYGRVLRDKETGEALKEKLFIDIDQEPKEYLKYGLTSDIEGKSNDEWTLKMAWVSASAMARVFGAGARNDTEAAGYDGFTKMHILETYRNKMINKNADEAGNPYTVHQFKMLAMDPMNAIVTESFKEVRDENGNVKMKDGKPVTQAKTFMEVLREMQSSMTAYNARLKQHERELEKMEDGAEKDKKEKDLGQMRKEMNERYQNVSGQLAFKNRAMSNYYDDHLMRAHETYKLIMGAEEVKMEKYVTFDSWGGVNFNREEFQEDVQHKMIHPIRYFLNTYPDINYNQVVRMLDQADSIRKHKPMYRDMPLGEAMFGHELLDRDVFWKKDEKGNPINMVDKNGRRMKGIYEIDYDNVNDNKVEVWKQFFLTKISADLWSHIAYHSTDNSFGISYYNNVLKAIESIPGELISDEYSIRTKAQPKNFFNEKDMAWLRKIAKTRNSDLYLRGIISDVFRPDDPQEGIGLLAAMTLLASEIVRREGA